MSGVKQQKVFWDDGGETIKRFHEVDAVLACDYDRDTQALKDELDNIKRSWGLILSQRDALAAERSWAETELPKWRDLAEETRIERDELRKQVEVMRALIDTPHTDEWFEAVRLEAAHQIKRWGADHDAGKAPADWFWLLGYLGGKALAAAIAGNTEKAKHHTISSGAALLNWFRALTGDSDEMRPGIDAVLQDPKP